MQRPALLLLLGLFAALPGVAAPAPVDYAELAPIPNKTGLNPGLAAADVALLSSVMGAPDLSGVDCSKCHNELATAEMQQRFELRDVGPFSVTGHKAALDSLERVLAQVKAEQPELYAQMKTAGMLCVRWRKKASTGKCFAPASVHSYGIAVDIYFGKTADFKADGKCARGLVALYPYFHAAGWYWGAAFETNEDPMHFELAEETLEELNADGEL
jgi:hypothetical protein